MSTYRGKKIYLYPARRSLRKESETRAVDGRSLGDNNFPMVRMAEKVFSWIYRAIGLLMLQTFVCFFLGGDAFCFVNIILWN